MSHASFFWAGDKNDRRPATNNNGNLVRDVFSHMCIAMCRRCWNGRSYWGPGRRRTRGRSSCWSTGFVYLFYWLLYKRHLLSLSPFIRPSLSFPHPRALGQPCQLQVSHLLFFSFILLFGKVLTKFVFEFLFFPNDHNYIFFWRGHLHLGLVVDSEAPPLHPLLAVAASRGRPLALWEAADL